MPGCWVRTWNDDEDGFEFVEPYPTVPSEVYMTEPEMLGVLLGADGEPLSVLYDREPIGYRQRYE
jgi:hypothetical protein